MKTLLLNDTSWYHHGCKEVITVLKKYYTPSMLCGNRDEIDLSIIQEFDRVVLNGEGTLHHNAPWAKKFLGYIREAQRLGKETHIVNTVWQEMSADWADVINTAEVVEVREVFSRDEMTRTSGRTPVVVLDASLHSTVDYIPMEAVEICVGGSFYGELDVEWDTYTRINIFSDSWPTLVNTLRHAKLLITGRHHEMYAALRANIPVITVAGNTWKNEAFFHTIGVPELLLSPTRANIYDMLDGKYDSVWNEVWEKMNRMELKYAE